MATWYSSWIEIVRVCQLYHVAAGGELEPLSDHLVQMAHSYELDPKCSPRDTLNNRENLSRGY